MDEQFDGSDEMTKKYPLYYIPQINSFMGNEDIKGTLMIGDWIVKHEDGSEFIKSFNKSYYQDLQKEYSDYPPKVNPNDKRFIFEED